MVARTFIIFLLFSFFLFVHANRTNRNLNLQQLQNRCLAHQSTAVKSSTCTTQKKLKMQITRGVENGVFYCLTYEKTTGNVYGFDSLTIELHPDYDLQYSGANVIDYEFPSFKLYDVRVTEEYKGRFAIYSNNTSFKIYQVTINNEQQNCTYGKGKNRHIWPEQRVTEDIDEHTTIMNIIKSTTVAPSSSSLRTSISATTTAPEPTTTVLSSSTLTSTSTTPLTITTEIPNFTELTQKDHEFTTDSVLYTTILAKIDEKSETSVCGVSLKILDFKQFQIPYNPGEFPFAVSIFQILNFDKHHYKCSGTIINNRIILTSVNCLLDHNSKLIGTDKLMVYTAQYFSLFRNFTQNSKVYNVEKIMLHENYSYNLENNIAAIKVDRNIEFDDFTQPVCLPERNIKIKDDTVTKLVGFGKSNVLTESNFHIKTDDFCKSESESFSACQAFYATSTTIEYTDLGCGLYISDENNRWILIGISSGIPHHLTTEFDVMFTNVIFFIDWIEKVD